MNDLQKSDGKGSFAIKNWEELRRGGGLAPSPVKVRNYLQGNKVKLSRDELTGRIQGYFDDCIEGFIDPDTGQEGYTWKTCPTKAGLAMHIGVSSFTLSRYLRIRNGGGVGYNPDMPGHRGVVDPSDFDLLESAVTLIESFYEGNLGRNMNNSGSIFWLKNRTNIRWHDEQDLNLTANADRDEPYFTREEIAARYQAYKELPEKPDLD